MEQKWSLSQLPCPTSSHHHQIFLLLYASLTLVIIFISLSTSGSDCKYNSSWQVLCMWSKFTHFCQTLTSKCLKRTLVSVSLKCEGHRTDSMITTRRSLGFTSRCLKKDKMHKIKLGSFSTYYRTYLTVIFHFPQKS